MAVKYYLYIKTHKITGLRYLGITKKKNPHKYRGSGTTWNAHLKAYGCDMVTEILVTCYSKNAIKEWGMYYSKLWQIVRSNKWANKKPENGYDGQLAEGTTYRVDPVTGSIIVVDKTDKRVVNGTLKHFNADATYTKIICPHCGKYGTNLHIIYCQKNPERITHPREGTKYSYEKIPCRHCGAEIGKNILARHEAACCENPDAKSAKNQMKDAPCCHCGEIRKLSGLKKHEDSCKQNPNRVPGMSAGTTYTLAKIECQYCQKQFSSSNIKQHERRCQMLLTNMAQGLPGKVGLPG